MRNKEFRCHASMIFADSIKGFIYLLVALIGGFFEEITTEFGIMLDEGEIPSEALEQPTAEFNISIWFIALGVAILLGVFLLWRYFVWRRTYITLTDDTLIYDKRTYFFKKKINVDLKKIGTVNLKIGVFDWIFNTCTVKLDMSSGATANETDFRLVFKRDFAKAFEREIIAIKNGEIIEAEQSNGLADVVHQSAQNEKPIFFFKFIYVLRHAVLSANIIWILFLGIAFSCFAVPWESIPVFLYPLVLFLGVPVAFAFVIISSAVKTVFRYGDFLVSRTNKEIVISSGLVTKHSYRLPVSATNAVIIRQTLLGRIFRMYYADILNVGMDDENDKNSQPLCLMVNRRDMEKFLSMALPEFATEFQTTPSPKKAFFPTFIKAAIVAAILSVINVIITVEATFFEEVLTYLFIWGGATLVSVLAFKTKGIFIGERLLTVSNGILSKRIVLVPYSKIQMLKTEFGPVSGPLKLKHGTVHILAGALNQSNSVGYFSAETFEAVINKIEQYQTVDWRLN